MVPLRGRVGVVGVDGVEGDLERLAHRVPAIVAHERIVELIRELLRRLVCKLDV